MPDGKKLPNEALDTITPEKWKKSCAHVVGIEDYDQTTERIRQAIETVIIHLGSDIVFG